MNGFFRSFVAVWLALCLGPRPAWAQHEAHAMPATPGWSWHIDAQAFLNANLQERKFTDLYHLESQNWLHAVAGRPLGRARLTLTGMLSGEDWTLSRYGSPQVFQSGETYGGAVLIDYQHPHDLIMAASARLDWPAGLWFLSIDGGPVAAPALGPEPFMHRASAEGNPTTPLGHHMLDSTHTTHGAVTIGATRGRVTVEASYFNGREPDEDRVAIELAPFDSYAARVTWRGRAWRAQLSGGRINSPSPTEFTDHVLVTASVSHDGDFRGRPLSFTMALGLTRETAFDLTMPALLAEGAWRVRPRDLLYARVEWVEKDLLTPGGYDPPGFDHPHILSSVGALTAGYEREILRTRVGRFGLGGDVTVYAPDPNLELSHGQPFSTHLFLRYRR